MEEKNKTQDQIQEQDQTQTLKEFVKNSKLALIETIEDIDDPVQKHNVLANEARKVNDIIFSHEKNIRLYQIIRKNIIRRSARIIYYYSHSKSIGKWFGPLQCIRESYY